MACFIGLVCFGDLERGTIVVIYSDNKNAVSWLKKGRSRNLLGMKLLAAWELQKYVLACKTSPKWIPGEQNNTADALSRGRVPSWLKRVNAVERTFDLRKLACHVANADQSWDSILE